MLAPSILQFREPDAEVSSPELERVASKFFELWKPDVVHFHNIEGFSSHCVAAAKQAGARVLFSLHNYHTICPQVYLMQRHREPCFDSAGGARCEGCIETPDPSEERAKRCLPKLPTIKETDKPDAVTQLFSDVRSRFFSKAPATVKTPIAPGEPVVDERSVHEREPAHSDETRGKAQRILGERNPRRLDTPDAPEWQPLANAALPDPSDARESQLNRYGHRRAAMVSMLNKCDRVLAVSEFVRAKYEAMGVDRARLSTLHIGTALGRIASRHAELNFPPPPPPPVGPARPLRLVFMGINHWYKGLPMLCDALELLTPEYLARIDLAVHSLGGDSILWRFKRLEPRLARLVWGGAYEPQDVPWICGGRDLGLVPSVWWDNAPQTVFEFFACGLPIIGANLGGIPDFVRHGENGLLFRGNDRYDLSRTIVMAIDNPALVAGLRRNVSPPKAIEAHAEELETIYAEFAFAGEAEREKAHA